MATGAQKEQHGQRGQDEDDLPRFLELLPQPDPTIALIGIAGIIRKVADLKEQHARYNNGQTFIAGRIHGLTQALALVYGVPFAEVKKILED